MCRLDSHRLEVTMRKLVLGAGLATFAVFATGTARAFCAAPPPKVCSAYFQADVVLRGKVLAWKYVPYPGHVTNWIRYTLRVEKTFKGRPQALRVLYTENDSGRLWLTVGKSYVVFGYRSQKGLEIGCDEQPLSNPAKTSAVSQEIDRLLASKPTHSTIEGAIVASNFISPLPGVSVTAIGAGHTFRTASDSKGQFSMRVPPGRYRIEVDPGVAQQTIYSRIYVDPQSIELAAGQCAQLQYEGVGR
jgi:Carboxypeptidase regulatory-like domain